MIFLFGETTRNSWQTQDPLHISDCIKYNLAGVNIVLQNPCEKTLYIKIKEAIACPFRFTGKKPGGNETWYSCDLQDVRWSMPRRLHRKTCNSSLSVAWFSTLPSLLCYWVLLIVRPDDALRCKLGGRVGARGPAATSSCCPVAREMRKRARAPGCGEGVAMGQHARLIRDG